MTRPPFRLGLGDRRRGSCRDAIGLVERQFQVEHGIAGRGDARGMGERGKADAALPPCLQRAPVERKAGRRRFERHRVGGDRRPHIPQRQRLRDMRILDRPAVPRQPGQHMGAAADEAQLDKARVAGKTLHDGVAATRTASRSPGDKRRRGRAGLPCACDDRRRRRRWPAKRVGSPIDSQPASRISIGSPLGRCVPAEAGRQGRGVVGNDQVAGAEQAFPARCAADGGCGRPPRR